jgi:hypothetical protein
VDVSLDGHDSAKHSTEQPLLEHYSYVETQSSLDPHSLLVACGHVRTNGEV